VKAEDLMAKAVQAVASAKVLLDTGDADGACNRACYALFDAARAALLALGHDWSYGRNWVTPVSGGVL
jgi:uncharacterized protein (UPF0332 family)